MIIKVIKIYNSKITAKYENSIYIMNNAKIHRTGKIIILIKEKIWSNSQSSLFTRAKQNRKYVWKVKDKISFQNLNSKELKNIIIKEIIEIVVQTELIHVLFN